MPEGDTIFRLARRLDRALRGKTVLEIRSPLDRIAQAGVAGRVVVGVESRGRNLLAYFDDGRVHTHMKMDGTWRVLRSGAAGRRVTARRHRRVRRGRGLLRRAGRRAAP